jgi:hypothetical protein
MAVGTYWDERHVALGILGWVEMAIFGYWAYLILMKLIG